MEIDTIYINRVNTNAGISNRINNMMEEEGRKKNITSFADAHNKLKWKRAFEIRDQENTSTHKLFFENGKIENGHATKIVTKEE